MADRISIQISAKHLDTMDVGNSIGEVGITTADLWWGNTIYNNRLEMMVRIDVHDTSFNDMFMLWKTLVSNCPGVECARVYWTSCGTVFDECAKVIFAEFLEMEVN